jgi:hypothetical protein
VKFTPEQIKQNQINFIRKSKGLSVFNIPEVDNTRSWGKEKRFVEVIKVSTAERKTATEKSFYYTNRLHEKGWTKNEFFDWYAENKLDGLKIHSLDKSYSKESLVMIPYGLVRMTENLNSAKVRRTPNGIGWGYQVKFEGKTTGLYDFKTEYEALKARKAKVLEISRQSVDDSLVTEEHKRLIHSFLDKIEREPMDYEKENNK